MTNRPPRSWRPSSRKRGAAIAADPDAYPTRAQFSRDPGILTFFEEMRAVIQEHHSDGSSDPADVIQLPDAVARAEAIRSLGEAGAHFRTCQAHQARD